MSYMDKVNTIIYGRNVEAMESELVRQRALLQKQCARYSATKPQARFAVASHITKTESKIARLVRALDERGVTNA